MPRTEKPHPYDFMTPAERIKRGGEIEAETRDLREWLRYYQLPTDESVRRSLRWQIELNDKALNRLFDR